MKGLPLVASLIFFMGFMSLGMAKEQLPTKLTNVGIEDKTGETIFKSAVFLDEQGRSVQTGDFFKKNLPVIFTVAYFNCPMLCSMVHKGLLDALNESGLMLGKDFELLTLSMDPRDKPNGAAAYREKYLSLVKKQSPDSKWPFLTGDAKNIQQVTDSVGFRFKYDKQINEYLHQAGVFVLSPSGKITRVLTGISWKAFDLKMAVIEAKQDAPLAKTERSLSAGEQLLLFCYSYNPSKEGYALKALAVMRIGGALTVMVLISLIFILKRRETHV